MIGTGRYITCRGCGKLFSEGCVRGEFTCSDKCREKVNEERKRQEAMIQAEINKNKPFIHDYQI